MIQIEKWLLIKGISKKELADYLEIYPQNINRLLRNPRIPIPMIQRICEYIDVPIDQILTTSEKKIDEQIRLRSVEIPFIPVDRQYEYCNCVNKSVFFASLAVIPFILNPNQAHHYVSFEIASDDLDNHSSYSIQKGDIVLCRRVSANILSKRRLDLFLLIHHRIKGILLRRLEQVDESKGTLHVYTKDLRETLFLDDLFEFYFIEKFQRTIVF